MVFISLIDKRSQVLILSYILILLSRKGLELLATHTSVFDNIAIIKQTILRYPMEPQDNALLIVYVILVIIMSGQNENKHNKHEQILDNDW